MTSYYLQPARFYKAILKSTPTTGIRSRTLLPLTGLNDPEGFSWTFRVKTGESARCTVNTVTVMPAEKYETVIGARQLFVAQPIGSPDACNEDGQPLVSDASYEWASTVPRVANFFLRGRLIRRHASSNCNGQCLRTGSDGRLGWWLAVKRCYRNREYQLLWRTVPCTFSSSIRLVYEPIMVAVPYRRYGVLNDDALWRLVRRLTP